MKKLILMRHAKSDWGTVGQADFDRPLNERGAKDAGRMGKELWRRGGADLVVSSSAVRASQTVQILCAQWPDYSNSNIEYEAVLYASSPETILEVVHTVPNDVNSVLLVAHNPGISKLLFNLTGTANNPDPEEFKTATAASVSFKTPRWAGVVDGAGKLEWMQHPRDLSDE